MVYEIYFCPEAGMWRIRIITYTLLFIPWSRDIKVASEGDKQNAGHVKQFKAYSDAVAYAQETGLDNAYVRRDRRGGHASQFNGIAVHANSA